MLMLGESFLSLGLGQLKLDLVASAGPQQAKSWKSEAEQCPQ